MECDHTIPSSCSSEIQGRFPRRSRPRTRKRRWHCCCHGGCQKKNLSFSLVKEAMGARSNTARSGSRPPQEQEKSLALVTIQSVGLISVSLAAVTFLLYWFAGPSFVHLGPRSYPVKSSVIESGVSRNGAGIVGTDGDAAVGITGTEKAPRLIGGGTREAFKFEGFPEVARSKP